MKRTRGAPGITIAAAIAVQLATPVVARGQVSLDWIRFFSGPHSDQAIGIAVNEQGDAYVTGSSQDAAAYTDFVTLKYSEGGQVLWESHYPSPEQDSVVLQAEDIEVDCDGDIVVVGLGPVIKYDPDGDTLWVRSARHSTTGVCTDGSRNVYVTGNRQDSIMHRYYGTTMFDATGAEVWSTEVNPVAGFMVADIAVDGLGRSAVCATDGATGSTDIIIIRYDHFGDTLWTSRYDTGPLSGVFPLSIGCGLNGETFVTGWTNSLNILDDIVTVMFDSTGALIWSRHVDGSGHSGDRGQSLVVTPDGNVCIAGFVAMTGSSRDGVVIKYDTAGNELWRRVFDSGLRGTEQLSALAVDSQGVIYAVGHSSQGESGLDFLTLAFALTGELLWSRTIGSGEFITDFATDVAVTADGTCYVTGVAGGDYCTVQYVSCGCPCYADPNCDGVRSNIQDVVTAISAVFDSATPSDEGSCPGTRTDVDCDLRTDIVDVVKIIGVAVRGANPSTTYCDPCRCNIFPYDCNR